MQDTHSHIKVQFGGGGITGGIPPYLVCKKTTMGKLNAALLRYLSKDDFRVLTGVRS